MKIDRAITASKELGTKKAKLICSRTSRDVTGDYSGVVGYASITFDQPADRSMTGVIKKRFLLFSLSGSSRPHPRSVGRQSNNWL